ncbi:MAG: outer membrane protein assembly factor BamC [Burkholderiaceae bacterium]|nr:outer membrane protein assembly factor BamC [Burkholderiaceae bacterium]
MKRFSLAPASFPAVRLTAVCALTLLLGACSSLDSTLEPGKVDYKSAGHGVSLEVPPDLTQLPSQSRYTMPNNTASANSYQAGQKVTQSTDESSTAANKVGEVHYMRNGDQRWLHVDENPDKVWGQVREFWQESGFLLTVDDPKVGVLETDWAENRAKIPDDFIRNTLGKLLDSLYSTGERDKFRTRVERTTNGGADIYITHQGMQEVYTTPQRDQTAWQPRPEDPGLEAIFLRRLMVKLGASQEAAKAQIASGGTPVNVGNQEGGARLVVVDGQQSVQFQDDFDRAWLRVGLALDRSNFTVEDRDRSKGLYYVRYADPTAEKQEPGFFSKLLGKASAPLPTTRYQIAIKTSAANLNTMTVLKEDGSPAASGDAQRILKVLADQLK